MNPLQVLDAALYEYSEVDNYLGLPSGTARRWINGYERQGKRYPPVIRHAPRTDDRLATFGELARVRTIEFDEGIAASFSPRPNLPEIVINGLRHTGAPVIRGTSIRPHAVARLVQAGDDISRIADAYEIPERAQNAAGRFVFGDEWRLAA